MGGFSVILWKSSSEFRVNSSIAFTWGIKDVMACRDGNLYLKAICGWPHGIMGEVVTKLDGVEAVIGFSCGFKRAFNVHLCCTRSEYRPTAALDLQT